MLFAQDMSISTTCKSKPNFFKLISAIFYLIFVLDDEDNSFIALVRLLYKTGTF